ncbi:hypothetical protein ACWCQ0_03810 [Streptomyces massasporeus]|uniref:hypothetical protein n=1 Tax=Streptomyces massasporeus TaxID=67324 RepID=UPI0033C388ED
MAAVVGHRAPRSVFERFDLARLLGEAEGGPVASPAAAADPDGPVRDDVRWAVAAGALGLAAVRAARCRHAARRPDAKPDRRGRSRVRC